MSQVWVLYYMDLRFSLVAMFINLSHGSTLYSSAAMMRRHLIMIQKYWCIVDDWLTMISDQYNSCLEVINFSFKDLSYRIPLASIFGKIFATHKYYHHQVMRPQKSVFSLNPKLWSENTGLGFNPAYENPASLFPLIQGLLPSLVMPTVYW